MSSWKSFVFKITCHIKQTILCWMSALGQNSEKGVRDYCKFNSAWNGSSKRRVRAEFCLGTDPCESEGFIEFMGGCKGTLPCGSLWRFFWCRNKSSRPSSSHQDDRRAGERETNKEKKRSGKIFGTVTNHLLAKLQSCLFYLQITIKQEQNSLPSISTSFLNTLTISGIIYIWMSVFFTVQI